MQLLAVSCLLAGILAAVFARRLTDGPMDPLGWAVAVLTLLLASAVFVWIGSRLRT